MTCTMALLPLVALCGEEYWCKYSHHSTKSGNIIAVVALSMTRMVNLTTTMNRRMIMMMRQVVAGGTYNDADDGHKDGGYDDDNADDDGKRFRGI